MQGPRNAGRAIIQTMTTIFCPNDHKRVATFERRGLLAWCKVCKAERLLTWAQIEQIRQSYAGSPEEEPPA